MPRLCILVACTFGYLFSEYARILDAEAMIIFIWRMSGDTLLLLACVVVHASGSMASWFSCSIMMVGFDLAHSAGVGCGWQCRTPSGGLVRGTVYPPHPQGMATRRSLRVNTRWEQLCLRS